MLPPSRLAGLARDRLEYMAHLPELPSLTDFLPVISLTLALFLHGAFLCVNAALLLREASLSTLTLLLFPAAGEPSH